MQEISPELLALATPGELAAYEQALRYELAMTSPLDYAEYVSPKTERTRHAEYLNRILVDLFEKRLRHPRTGEIVHKLAISMPPRHGKSYLVSDHLPAWLLTRWPEKGVILASYEADFAKTWGRKARQHIEEHPELGVHTNRETRAADYWFTSEGGHMATAGTGGPITGKGAGSALIIDDPIKNAKEAQSKTLRDDAYDWMLSTALTRRDVLSGIDETPVILMATRWHEDDLTGRMTSEDPDGWYVLNIAALALDDDPLGRAPGEALWPERFDVKALTVVRDTGEGGKVWFAAMYQGMPNIEGGGIFVKENFRYWGDARGGSYYALQGEESEGGHIEYVPKKECTRVITLDLAISKKTSADWTVAATWDVTKDRRIILVKVRRMRMESTEHFNFIEEAFLTDKAKYVIVEGATYGLSLIQTIRQNNITGHHIPVTEAKVDTDKITRAIPAGDLINMHRVYFPRFSSVLDVWERELLQFPNGTHDDQVDTISMMAWEVIQGKLRNAVRNPRTEPSNMQEKVDALLSKLIREKQDGRRPRHPILGKMR